MSPPPTAATIRARRMIDSMTCTELPAAAMGSPSRSAEAQSRNDEAGAILPSNCRGGRSNRMYLWMSIKHCRKRTSQARRAEQKQTNQRLAKVLQRENSLVILCSRLLMLQQEAESSRMSMLAKVSLRENSLVFFGAKLPMLQQVIKNVNHLINNHDFSGTVEQISFLITAEAKLLQAGLTVDWRTSAVSCLQNWTWKLLYDKQKI